MHFWVHVTLVDAGTTVNADGHALTQEATRMIEPSTIVHQNYTAPTARERYTMLERNTLP